MNKEVNELVKMLNSIDILDGGKTVTKSDLVHPTPAFAQEICFKFLGEFGMSEAMFEAPKSIIGSQDCGDLLEPLVLNVVCQRFFRKIGYKDLLFGLNDLMKPEGYRLRQFLRNFANFWAFCNSKYNEVEAVKAKVEEQSKKDKQLKAELSKKKKELESLKLESEDQTNMNAEVAKQIQEEEIKINKTKEEWTSLIEAGKEVKEKLLQAEERDKELEEKIEKLETEKRVLEKCVKSDTIKHELESEVLQLKEDHKNKELDIQRNRLDTQEYKAKAEEFKTILAENEALGKIRDKIKTNSNHLEQMKLEQQEVQNQHKSLDQEIVELQSEVKTVENELSKEAASWNKRKEILESEIREYQSELESEKKGKTQEDIVSSDLETEITKATKDVDKCQNDINELKIENRTLIMRMLDSYKNFEADFKQELDGTIQPAFKRLHES